MKIEGKTDGRGILTSYDIAITSEEREISGVASATVVMEPGELVRLHLQLQIERLSLDNLYPVWTVRHPETGDLIEIESVILKDGSELDLPTE